MQVSGRYSIGYDALIRYIFDDSFTEKVPTFKTIAEDLKKCRQTYEQKIQEIDCRCRIKAEWTKPCADKVLNTLEHAKENDHKTVRDFIRFIAQRGDDYDIGNLGVTIITGDKTYDIFIVADSD